MIIVSSFSAHQHKSSVTDQFGGSSLSVVSQHASYYPHRRTLSLMRCAAIDECAWLNARGQRYATGVCIRQRKLHCGFLLRKHTWLVVPPEGGQSRIIRRNLRSSRLFLSTRMSACPPACLPSSLSDCLPANLPACPPVSPPACVSA